MQQKFLHGLLILSGAGLLVFLIGKIMRGSSTGRVANVPKPIQEAFNKTFDSSVYSSIKDNWLAVSKMETAGWTSKLFNNGLNLWGMKQPKVRPTTAEGKTFGNTGRQVASVSGAVGPAAKVSGQSEWASYSDLNNAVRDIILWMDYTKFPRGPLSLAAHIDEMKKRRYFEEPIDYYFKAVKAWEAR